MHAIFDIVRKFLVLTVFLASAFSAQAADEVHVFADRTETVNSSV